MSSDLVLDEIRVSQGLVFEVQDRLLAGETIEPTMEHYFAHGVYGRLMKVPAGNVAVGKAHKTEHLAILLKGKITITMDDGSLKNFEAPMVMVVPPGKKKMVMVHEEMWIMNIHPTDTQDLDIIESRVIIPETEFRLQCNAVSQIEGVQ